MRGRHTLSTQATAIDPVQATPPLVLGLDAGTSSARAGLIDATGRALSGTQTQIGYNLRTTADGAAELDAGELLAAVAGTIDGALTAAGPLAGQIAAVGLSTFWHSLLGVDAAGRPVTTLTTWADRRAAGMAGRLAERLDAAAYHRRAGTMLHPSYPLTRLAWLREACPGQVSRVARWVSFGEYLYLTLFGQATCSISMASGTGMFDQARQVWDAAALAAVGVAPEQLSPLDDTPQRGLLPEWAARWPALAAVPWMPALGDGACSNLGSGAIGAERLGVTIGTTGAMRLFWSGPAVPPPPGLWLYRLDAGRVVLGGSLSEGGNLYNWLRDHLRLPAPDAIEAQLARMRPDSHGLTWLPFLAGERSPGWHAGARATLSGLTLDTEPLEILRAGLEAIAYRFALIADLLQDAMPGERTVIASGGALLRSPAWMQILADVLDRPVLASREPEASLKGAALMALERLGAGSAEDLAGHVLDGARRFEPDPARHAVYQAAMARQRELYARLIG